MARMTWRPASIVPIWIVVAAAIVVTAVSVPPARYAASFAVILGLAVLLVFAAQLVLQQREGLVRRVSIAVSGCVLLLLIASAVLLPLQFVA